MYEHSQRQELRALSRLLGPILVTQLMQTANGLADTVMAGQVSALDLAAVAMGAGICLPVFLLINGILLAASPLIAHAHGADRQWEVSGITHQALWLALALSLMGIVTFINLGPVLGLFNVAEPLRTMTQTYLQGIAFGTPAIAGFIVLRCYSEGLGHPMPVTVISILSLGLNVLLNYLLIYGHWGLPRLGGPGCGWATGWSFWASLIMMTAWIRLSATYRRNRLGQGKWLPSPPDLKHILRLGLPIGGALFFEVSVFSMIAIFLGPLGEKAVAGHQIALNVASLLFMLPLSLAIAMTIRVGHAKGRGAPESIHLTRQVGFQLTLVIALFNAAILVFGRHGITIVYTHDEDVRTLAANLLLFAAAFQVFDTLQVAAAGILRGLQDTRGPLIITLIAYWLIALPVGYTLGLSHWFGDPRGAYGFWAGLILGLMTAAALLNKRLKNSLSKLPNVSKETFPAADKT